MATIEHPHYPIIYVRGYAMREQEIQDTVATPYMGFNLGSTKIRQEWDRNVTKHIFESPLIRLMKDYEYHDIYSAGREIENSIPARSVIIYRYYEQADPDLGSGDRASIPEAADGLSELILKIRDKVCGDDQEAKDQFKVYLVAHSMGGLICRCLLQNNQIGSTEAKSLVDKVFTYGTPHNGIDMRGMNVPAFLGIWNINNFNRKHIADYLNLDEKNGHVNYLNNKFDPQKFFCLVGTNHRDYSLARLATGPMSDGLVKIENAFVQKAPRAFAYRSHSGHYGMVNSEEGYQNLVRFLFGDTRVIGVLEPDNLPLPPTVEEAYKDGKKIRASYYFESTVTPRGALSYNLSERTVNTNSAVLRTFDELFKSQDVKQENPRNPFLFSVFLDTSKITHGRTIVFTLDLVVRTTEYRINEKLFFHKRIPEENLYRQKITIRSTKSDTGWNIRYIPTDEEWGEKRGRDLSSDEQGPYIPLSSKKGFKGKLRLNIDHWNQV